MRDEASAIQLQLIGEVSELLTEAGISHWLFGGWAVDFLAGEVTRPHADIEFVVWEKDIAAARGVLAGHAYTEDKSPFPQERAAFLKRGQTVNLLYIERGEDGRVYTPGRWADWPWPHNSFSHFRAVLEGVKVPIVSVEGQLDVKTNYPRHSSGRPLREKDRHDIEILQRAAAGRPL